MKLVKSTRQQHSKRPWNSDRPLRPGLVLRLLSWMKPQQLLYLMGPSMNVRQHYILALHAQSSLSRPLDLPNGCCRADLDHPADVQLHSCRLPFISQLSKTLAVQCDATRSRC